MNSSQSVASQNALKVLKENALVVFTCLGLLGGFIGAIVSEVIQESGSDDLSYGTLFPDNVYLSTGFWFALAMVCIGAAMSLSQGLLEKNVEKSKMAALRTIPAAFVGGFFAGMIAQKVYESLTESGSGVIQRAIGWGIAGCLAGVGIGIGFGTAIRIRNAAIGGAIGGLIGGVMFEVVGEIVSDDVLSRFVGLTIIGGLIGLAIALIDLATTSAYLELHNVEGGVVRYPLLGRTHIIGCANSVSVAITRDPQMREQHVRLDMEGSGARFTCIGSAPPVNLNGQTVTQGFLSNGDQITVGSTTLRMTTSKNYGLNLGLKNQLNTNVQQQPTSSMRPTVSMPNTQPTRGATPPSTARPTQNPAASPPRPQSPTRPTIQMKPKND